MSLSTTHHKRLASAFAIAGVVIVAGLLGGWVWNLLTLIFFPIAYRELRNIMAAKSISPSQVTVVLFGFLFYGFACFGLARHFDILVTIGIIFTFSRLLFRKNPASISDIGGTILIFFYLGFLPAHFILIRQLGTAEQPVFWLQSGAGYLFWILFIVSASDVFAYYAGKRFGKNLLSPQISPKKTIEGSVMGTFMAMCTSVLIAWILHISWVHGVVFGLLISLAAQMGDLSESLLKRDAGVKDSGSIIPGHGGLLDRTDSYIFSGAIGYYYIVWFILHQGIMREILEWIGQ